MKFFFNKFLAEKKILTTIGVEGKKTTRRNLDFWTYGNEYYFYSYDLHFWTYAGKKGLAPNSQTGALRESIDFEINGDILTLHSGGGDVYYAHLWEYKGEHPNLLTIFDYLPKAKSIVRGAERILVKSIEMKYATDNK